ncbi:MAG: hypothetical protein U0625_00750 [Phycisphaerales bacterium]
MNRVFRWVSVVVSACLAGQSLAGFTVVTGAANANQWFGGAGAYTSITFSEFPSGTLVTEQYAAMGVHFVDPAGSWIQATQGFLQDGWGLHGLSSIDMRFDTPVCGLAVHYPGEVKAEFYSGDALVFSWQQWGGGEQSKFVGAFGDVAFDRVVFKSALVAPPWMPPYSVNFDNLYFSTVPTPGAALGVLGLLPIAERRRRNRRSTVSQADISELSCKLARPQSGETS